MCVCVCVCDVRGEVDNALQPCASVGSCAANRPSPRRNTLCGLWNVTSCTGPLGNPKRKTPPSHGALGVTNKQRPYTHAREYV